MPMDLDTLKQLAAETYEIVEPGGPPEATRRADELEEAGIVADMHVGADRASFDEVKTLEWALGQFVSVVRSKSWFAVNAILNRLAELSGVEG